MTGLLEVVVGSKSFSDPLVFHDDEAGAVGEPPISVRPILIQLPAPDKPVSIEMDNGKPRGGKEGLQEANDSLTIWRSCKAIRQLRQDVIGRDVVCPSRQKVSVQSGCRFMECITLVGEGEPGNRINEYPGRFWAHRFNGLATGLMGIP